MGRVASVNSETVCVSVCGHYLGDNHNTTSTMRSAIILLVLLLAVPVTQVYPARGPWAQGKAKTEWDYPNGLPRKRGPPYYNSRHDPIDKMKEAQKLTINQG